MTFGITTLGKMTLDMAIKNVTLSITIKMSQTTLRRSITLETNAMYHYAVCRLY
jgi:hypothetical protein